MHPHHLESHRTERTGWLRAAVLGANDGIVSTSSLLIGMAAAHASHETLLLTGAAGLVAGAMSMAAGEYISVYTQADTEQADLDLERIHLELDAAGEHAELVAIYIGRGLDPALADRVATQLMNHDALQAHARDELGISSTLAPRPIQAAVASGISFAVGAGLPLLVAVMAPAVGLTFWMAGFSLVFLAVLGALAASAGGANMRVGAIRVTFWGALAMAVTGAVGAMFGATV